MTIRRDVNGFRPQASLESAPKHAHVWWQSHRASRENTRNRCEFRLKDCFPLAAIFRVSEIRSIVSDDRPWFCAILSAGSVSPKVAEEARDQGGRTARL